MGKSLNSQGHIRPIKKICFGATLVEGRDGGGLIRTLYFVIRPGTRRYHKDGSIGFISYVPFGVGMAAAAAAASCKYVAIFPSQLPRGLRSESMSP